MNQILRLPMLKYTHREKKKQVKNKTKTKNKTKKPPKKQNRTIKQHHQQFLVSQKL